MLIISYAGGLDVKNGTTGETSVYTVFQDRLDKSLLNWTIFISLLLVVGK